MISAPQPSVIHLFTIFRQITGGELRIPAFQREFVWKERQVIDLLSSVRDQYPIGSILLWHVDRKMLQIASDRVSAFPNLLEAYPTNYILDGMQRLSSLYGVFHFVEGQKEIFNVYYNLRRRRFGYSRDTSSDEMIATIPLAALISPRSMLTHQANLIHLADGDKLLEELLQTQAAFQEYMIPVVKISDQNVNRIVGIFERVNSTGTRLETVDFMRAITWDQAFDLNEALDAAQRSLDENKLSISDETVIKCVGLLLGVAPSNDGLLSLRSRSPAELAKAFIEFPHGIALVAAFLEERLKIESSAYVPYEGQLLVLFKAVGMGEAVSQAELDGLERWFWAAGFNESLRGKPDHYVVRAVEGWRFLIEGQIRGLEPRLRLSLSDFLDRRLIKGKALSGAFAAMFAVRGAHSLITEKLIASSIYMTVSDLDSFQVIFSIEQLRLHGIEVTSSARIFPNIFLTTADERLSYILTDWQSQIVMLADQGKADILLSQFIDSRAVEYLRSNEIRKFFRRRAELMNDQALKLVGN